MQTNESVVTPQAEAPPHLALVPINPEALMMEAVQKNVSVETIERLMAMRRELRAEAAKEHFDRALAAFQAACPPIKKSRDVFVKGQKRYSYAPLEVIIEQIKGLLQEHGFCYTLNSKVEASQTEESVDDKGKKTVIARPGWVTATCELTHSFGHSKTSEFKVPIDKDAYMGEAQKFASALTFAKRYAFINSLGLMTCDEDDDSRGAQDEHPHREPAKKQQGATPRQQPKATTSDVLPKEATEKTRQWALKTLTDQFGIDLLREYFEKQGWLLPGAEKLEDWPLRFVPTSTDGLNKLITAIQVFEAGGAPPDPDDVDSPDAEWRSFPVPFGKDAGKKLADLPKNTLYGWCMNFTVETEYRGKPKKDADIARDRKFREMLDDAKEHYGFDELDESHGT